MITSYSNCLALKERFIALRFRTAEGSLKPASAICFDEKKTYSAFYSSINVPSEDLGLKSERIAKLLGFEVGVGVIIDCIRMGLIDRNVVDVGTSTAYCEMIDGFRLTLFFCRDMVLFLQVVELQQCTNQSLRCTDEDDHQNHRQWQPRLVWLACSGPGTLASSPPVVLLILYTFPHRQLESRY